MKLRGLFVLVQMSLVWVALGQGSVVYNSFGADGRYWAGSHKDMSFSSVERVGFRFSPSESGRLSSIDAGLFWFGGGVNSADLILCRNKPVAGTPGSPGLPMEVFVADQILELQDSYGFSPQVSFTSSMQPILDSAESYWLVLRAPVENRVGWGASPVAYQGTYLWYGGDGRVVGGYDQPAAFRVTVLPIPEPGSLALVMAWMGAISYRRLFVTTTV
jgi:hypothetical protein